MNRLQDYKVPEQLLFQAKSDFIRLIQWNTNQEINQELSVTFFNLTRVY